MYICMYVCMHACMYVSDSAKGSAEHGKAIFSNSNVLLFNILSDYQVQTTTIPNFVIWKDRIGNDKYVDLYNLKSLNEVIRNSNNIEYHP